MIVYLPWPDKLLNPNVDNLLAAYKSGIDGIADALKIDDSRFIYVLPPRQA